MLEKDEKLREYATDRQWEILEAYWKHGTLRSAAAALGIDKGRVHEVSRIVANKAALAGYSPEHDFVDPVPDGFRLKRHSQYYDKHGKAAGRWVIATPDMERQHQIIMEMVAELKHELPKAEPLPLPQHMLDETLLATYPVGDLHLGMLSWGVETGGDWDLKIGERLFTQAFASLVNAMPAAHNALIAFLGDFMHYDSFESVTPTNKHQLDADSRFPKMVRVAIRCMRRAVELALEKHASVHVIVEIGNHDLASSIWLMQALDNIYENEPRVTIDTSPKHYHYFRFGKNLIGTHHGHGAKMPQLPAIMANDKPQEWGDTLFRVWWTGHVHHDQAKDYPGCTVESHAVIGPEDAHAANKGYRSKRSMKAVLFHAEYGEVGRHTVNPAMFEAKEAA